MYKGVQKRFGAIVATLLLSCMLIGCGDSSDISTTNGTETAGEASETVGSQTIPDSTSEEKTDVADCPEGYVYDYQVSMDPIPEEIAALGGPCQGTIHAYPSRIAMALTELQMEEDPVLKAEVEKRIPEIEAALEEEIGGDFVVDGVILRDELTWVFICTEVATGYQFDLYYANQEYYAQKNHGISISNVITVANYYNSGKENVVLQENLAPIITDIYTESDIKIHSQLFVDSVDIIIVRYTEDELDKCSEQEKFLALLRDLQAYDETLNYDINVLYYPKEYQEMIGEKFDSTIRYDFSATFSEKISAQLIENDEIYANLYYSSSNNETSDELGLDSILQQYENGTYDNTVIWDYWIE